MKILVIKHEHIFSKLCCVRVQEDKVGWVQCYNDHLSMTYVPGERKRLDQDLRTVSEAICRGAVRVWALSVQPKPDV